MRVWIIALLCLLPVAAPLTGQPATPPTAALERAATQAVLRHLIPGLSVAVVSGDGPVWAAAWGFADVEHYVPATPDTVFRLASIAKPFTAVAALLLHEQGKLLLDVPVQQYVDFPATPWPVTTRMLLGHLGGIRHYRPNGEDYNSTRHFQSVQEALQMFAGDPLEHEPGTKYLYSSYGYNLAGAVVERAAGIPYDLFVRERILTPAGIASMQPDDVHRIIPRRARGYRRRPGGLLENAALADTSNKVPGGGWVAGAKDLVRFARALMDGRLLRRETIEMMWTPQKLKSGEATSYGLGWYLGHENGVRLVYHSGGQQGASSHLLLVPERRLAIAVLANVEDGNARTTAMQLLNVMMEGGKP